MKIRYYKFSDGRSPIDDYLDGLDVKMRVKVLRSIGLLASNGIKLRMPYSRSIGNGLFELRTQVGSNIERVLYFFFVDKVAVLTNGFTKKTQKTPDKEIEIAISRRKDYLKRYK